MGDRRVVAVLLLFTSLLGLSSAAFPVCNVRNSDACQQAAALTSSPTAWKYNALESRNADGTSTWLLQSPPFDITLESASSTAGVDGMKIIYKAVDEYEITLAKDVNGLHVEKIQKLEEGAGSVEQRASEAKILEVLSKLNSMEETNDGKILSIRTPSTTISFDKLPSPLRSVDLAQGNVAGSFPFPSTENKEFRLDVNSFFSDGHFKAVETSAPVKLYVAHRAADNMLVTVHGAASTFAYDIKTLPGGWVKSSAEVFFAKEALGGLSGDSNVENEIKELLKNVREIAFHGRRMELIGADGRTRVTFDAFETSPAPSNLSPGNLQGAVPKYYIVLAGSYQVNGHREDLYLHGYPQPATIQTIEVYPGRLDVILHAYDIINYQFHYNPADGWVTKIHPGFRTFKHGLPSQTIVQDKITEILGATQQIAFEKDGLIQFIKDNSATRIAFTPEHFRRLEASTSSRQLQEISPKYYNVVAGSYQVNGQSQQLFVNGSEFRVSLQATEVYPGRLDVLMRAFNTFRYQIDYNVADGWVASITPVPTTLIIQGPPPAMDVEMKLQRLVGNAQQIAFENDGLMQFISDYSATRIAFSPDDRIQPGQTGSTGNSCIIGRSNQPDSGKVLVYEMIPDTYQVDGTFTSLFPWKPFPVIVETSEIMKGRLNVALKVVNSIIYHIDYNVVDGSVTQIVPGTSTFVQASPDIMQAEEKLKTLIGSATRVLIHDNGLLEFIKDHSTRIAFNKLPSQEVKYYDILGGSEDVVNSNVSLSQFQLITSKVAPGRIGVTLVSPNGAITYTMSYDEADGWVSAIDFVESCTASTGSVEVMEVESALHSVLGTTQQIAFEKDGLIQFITDYSATRVAFKPQAAAPVGKEVGSSTPPEVNAIAEVSAIAEVIQPGKMLILFKTVDGAVPYEISYNEADGVVFHVGSPSTEGTATEVPGRLPTSLESEVAAISRVDIKGGHLTISKINGDEFLTFVPQEPEAGAVTVEALSVMPESYKVNGSPAQLFDSGVEFPVIMEATEAVPGQLEVFLKAGSTMHYLIRYNPQDGAVESVTLLPASVYSSSIPENRLDVEEKLKALLASTEHVSFQPEIAEFMNKKTATSIAFKAINRRLDTDTTWVLPPSRRACYIPESKAPATAFAGKRYALVDGSYHINGKSISLFPFYQFPVIVETSELIKGRLEVTLKVVNSTKYYIDYNLADGWVIYIRPGDSTNTEGPWEQMEVEKMLKELIGATQHLAFEEDGKLQFITNNNAARVAFQLTE